MFNDILSFLDEKSNPKDNILYHYTTQRGLIGIIESKSIWATDIRYLNDTEEYSYSLKMFKDKVQNHELFRKEKEDKKHEYALSLENLKKLGEYAKRGTEDEYRLAISSRAQKESSLNDIEKSEYSFLELLNNILNFDSEKEKFLGLERICVSSFSEEGDQLSQWRGYCSDSIGYSIGFDYDKLINNSNVKIHLLRSCVYEPEKQHKILNDLLSNYLKQLSGLNDSKTSSRNDIIREKKVVECAGQFLSYAPFLKNKSFEEEREWRLAAYPINQKGLKVRDGKSMLIP